MTPLVFIVSHSWIFCALAILSVLCFTWHEAICHAGDINVYRIERLQQEKLLPSYARSLSLGWHVFKQLVYIFLVFMGAWQLTIMFAIIALISILF